MAPSPLTMSLALRAGLGAAAYLAPRPVARSMGIDPAANPAAPYLGRVFGARDVVLAASVLRATGRARRDLVLGCAVVDLLDTGSALMGWRGRYLSGPSSVALAGVALTALVPEVLDLRRGRAVRSS